MDKNVRLFVISQENLRELLELNGIYPVIDHFNGEKHEYRYAKCDEFYDVWNNRKIQVDKEDLIYLFDRDRAIDCIAKGNRLFAVRNSREGGFMYMLVKKNAIKKYIVTEEDKKIHQKFVETAELPKEKKTVRKPIKDLDKVLEELDMKYEQPKVTKKRGRH